MPTKIEPDKILRELNRVWATLSQQDGSTASGGGVLRACAMTLIVVTQDPPGDASLTETLALLMRVHPSRAIVIRLVEREARELSASVNAQCWRPFGSRQQICSEIIEIEAAKPALPDLPAVLRGLTAADLPVILWLRQQELVELPALEIGDKIIVDSSGTRSAAWVLDHIRTARAGRRLVADLSWARLTRWRETIAHIFANPARQEKIGAIQTVTVSYLGESVPVRAIYLVGWLQTILGDRPSYKFQPVSPAAPECKNLEVQGVKLDGPGIDISIKLRDGASAELRLDDLNVLESFSLAGEYDLLREELSVLGSDPAYEAVLDRAYQLAK